MPRRPDPNRCPGCGERVSAYAAGCAVCGYDLEAHRRRPARRPRVRLPAAVPDVERGLVVAVLIVVALVLLFAMANRAEQRDGGSFSGVVVTASVQAR